MREKIVGKGHKVYFQANVLISRASLINLIAESNLY